MSYLILKVTFLVLCFSNVSKSQFFYTKIENEDFLLEISQDTSRKSSSSFKEFGNNIKAKGATLDIFLQKLLPDEDKIIIENLPKDKFNFNLISFRRKDEIKNKLLTEIGEKFNLKLKIEDGNSQYFEIKTEDFSQLKENYPKDFEVIDSIVENDSLKTLATVEGLANFLSKNSQNKHIYLGHLPDKYYFEIDLKDISKSLIMNGLIRFEKQKSNKIYSFGKISN